MAGILGYTGLSQAAPHLLGSMKYIEYEGYDSWGICTADDDLHLRKEIGGFDEEVENGSAPDLPGRRGIAHTRWATSGEVSRADAHPHLDCGEDLAVVQNGVIDSWRDFKDDLEGKGHHFSTMTDTEVIPHLIEDRLSNGFSMIEAVKEACRLLDGSFSFALMSAGAKDEAVIAARKRHPIYVGHTGGSSFVTSEPSCLPGRTHRAAPLPSGAVALLSPGRVRLENYLSEDELAPRWTGVDRRFLATNRIGYRHYLEKEIALIPDMLQIMALGELIDVELLADAIESSYRLTLLCEPRSYNAALSISHVLGDIARHPCRVLGTEEFLRGIEKISEKDTVLGLGCSPIDFQLLEALRSSRANGARTAAITANGSLKIRGLAQPAIKLGRDHKRLSPLATFAGQVGLSVLLAYSLIGRVEAGMKELTEVGDLMKLHLPAIRTAVHSAAPILYRSRRIVFFGRNLCYPVALEAANNLDTLADLPTMGLENPGSGRQTYLHLGPDSGCVFFAREGDSTTIRSAEWIGETGAMLIGISEGRSWGVFNSEITLPESNDLFPAAGILPAQMLAYEAALLRGRNPDDIAYRHPVS